MSGLSRTDGRAAGDGAGPGAVLSCGCRTDQAGLRGIDGVLIGLTTESGHLLSVIGEAAALLRLTD
jgi:hypothetical protein